MFIEYKIDRKHSVMVEVTPEVAQFILDSDTEMRNAEQRERYHVPYHINALEYEGMEYADPDTTEDIVLRNDENRELYDCLSFLTESQLRRLVLKAEGMTLREIAAAEGTSVNAVAESLMAARKKLEKYRVNHFLCGIAHATL